MSICFDHRSASVQRCESRITKPHLGLLIAACWILYCRSSVFVYDGSWRLRIHFKTWTVSVLPSKVTAPTSFPTNIILLISKQRLVLYWAPTFLKLKVNFNWNSNPASLRIKPLANHYMDLITPFWDWNRKFRLEIKDLQTTQLKRKYRPFYHNWCALRRFFSEVLLFCFSDSE